MKKLLRYFPLSKKIQKKDAKSLLITVGIYLAVILAATIITKILGSEILYYRYLFIINE